MVSKKAGGLEQLLCLMFIVVDFVWEMLQEAGIEGEKPIEIQEFIISLLQKEAVEAFQEKKDILTDAREKLLSWAYENHRNFVGLVEPDKLMGIWGVIWEDDKDKKTRIFVSSNAFAEFCNRFGFVRRQVVEAFENSGLLVSNRAKGKGCIKKILGRSVMGYCFILPSFSADSEETPEDISF